MKYLIYSTVGCGFYMIPHLGQSPDTEKVYFYCADTGMGKLGKGMEQFRGWEKYVRVKDPFDVIGHEPKENLIIIFDDNGYGDLADYLRKEGYSVCGGAKIADTLENDRWGTIQYMQKLMDVPETEYHADFQSGLASLKSKEKSERWCFKPQDADAPKDKTYVGKDIHDLMDAMQEFAAHWEWGEGFVLQKFVEGIEADFNCYFSGEDWIEGTFGWYFENKPFLSGDHGSATGGEIAATFYRKNEGAAFAILQKMTPLLKKYNYHGQMAINSIVSKEDHKPYFLELTPRFGYPGSDMEITLIEESGKQYADFIKQIAKGGKGGDFYPLDKISVELTVSTPPYPSDKGAEEMASGLPFSWDKKWDRYMFPWYCQYDEKTKGVKLTGNSGHALHVTCVADNLQGAVQMVYDEYLPTVQIQNKQFRNDLGEDARKRIKQLHEWKVL